jgi:hypothetical protein
MQLIAFLHPFDRFHRLPARRRGPHKRMMSEPVVKGNALFTSSPLTSSGLSQRKARKPEHEGRNSPLWEIQRTDNGTLRILYKQADVAFSNTSFRGKTGAG